MREPKIGDKIVVTRFEGIDIEPELVTVECIADSPGLKGGNIITDGEYGGDSDCGNQLKINTKHIGADSGEILDNWRYAVRKGDRLVVTKMDGKTVEPTVVTATEDEYTANTIFIDHAEWAVLGTMGERMADPGGKDEWHFAEEGFHIVRPDGHHIISSSPINDICDSFNDVVAKDDVTDEDVELAEDCEDYWFSPQTYSEFNAAQGGGKTLKDYTGVGITPKTLGFVSDRDKTLEGITAESLAFEESVEDADMSQDTNMVEHPPHYNKYEREVIESIRGLCTPDEFRGYLKGNIIKYSARYSDKDGVRDIDKLAQYTQFLREFEVEMEDE